MIDKLKIAGSKQANQFPPYIPIILVNSLTRSAIIVFLVFPFSYDLFSHLTFCPLAQRNFVAHSPREVQKLLVAVEIQFGRNASVRSFRTSEPKICRYLRLNS